NEYSRASHEMPLIWNVPPLLHLLFIAHCGAGPVWAQPPMESPRTPYRNGRNALLQWVGTNSIVVRDLTLSVSKVDALPSKKARIHRPAARPEQCQGGTESSQQNIDPQISGYQEDLPHF